MKVKLIPLEESLASQLIATGDFLSRCRRDLKEAVQLANRHLETSEVAPYVAEGMKRKLRKRGKCRILVGDDGRVYLELQIRENDKAGKLRNVPPEPVTKEETAHPEEKVPEEEPESKELSPELEEFPSVGVLIELAEKQGLELVDQEGPKKSRSKKDKPKRVKKAVALTEAEEVDLDEWDDLF